MTFELTDESRVVDGVTLYRIRATEPRPHLGVAVGDLGGWVESADVYGRPRIGARAWVYGDAQVSGLARVLGNAWVSGNARVFDRAQLFDRAQVSERAQVFDRAHVSDEARVYGDARVSGRAHVYGSARVSGLARVFDEARVFGHSRVFDEALVSKTTHVQTVGPIGSENATATLFRTKTGHVLSVGCWTGTLDSLAAEVEARAGRWNASDELKAAWRAQYVALEALGRATVATWEGVEG